MVTVDLPDREVQDYFRSLGSSQPGKAVHFLIEHGPTLEEFVSRFEANRRLPFDLEEIKYLADRPGNPDKVKVSRLVWIRSICQNEPTFPERRTIEGHLYLGQNSRWGFNFRLFLYHIHQDLSTKGYGVWGFSPKSA